nr:copia protein [Tanacetum cinerariifolium]
MNYELVTVGNQTNNDAGIEKNANAVKAGQEKASDHDYILLPFMPSNTQSSDDKDAGEVPYKGDECVTSTNINTGSLNINNVGPNDPNMPSLEDTSIFDDAYDDKDVGAKANTNNLEFTTVFSPIPTTRVYKDHPKEQIIRDLNLSTQTRRMLNFSEENAMRAIGTKWVFRNKKAERGIVIRNKAKLVAQGYTQEEGIDYDEVFAPVARIEAIRIFLAYALFMGFIVYQMYIKSVFLYGTIEEEVYVCQPPGFQDPHFPNKVYKVKQKDDGIFISQDKYVADILKNFDFTMVKTTSTPIEPNKTLIKDAEAEDVSNYTKDFTSSCCKENLLILKRGKLMLLSINLQLLVMVSAVKTSAKVKTVNDDVWLQALVDGKVIVNETSIRYDLRLDDAEGTACLLNDDIFEGLVRMGAKTTAWNEFSSTMASTIIWLANNQKFNFSKYILENMVKNLEAGVKFYMFPRFVQVFINNQLCDMSHHKVLGYNCYLSFLSYNC